MRKVVVIGDGGHGKVIREIIEELQDTELVGILDDKFVNLHVENNLYKGPSSAAIELFQVLPGVQFILGVGANTVRKQLFERLGLPLESYTILVHPSAVISKSAQIQNGTVVMAASVVQADTNIGAHSIINTGVIVEHDNQIGDYVHLSPGTVLTGEVKVKAGAHVGAGTVVIPGKTIGCRSITGAGATVIDDIPDDATAVGIPARIIKNSIKG
ncbi:acetyltransferase [Bacillus sp. CLL-7-23]|uniref:Acetyltransferase n=1 Tax=Bacillus changyiensis TaxID=3004103 RepID=A0ABT4X538_9BACI|nr:acetyltransferase [Bacillus changyiensis]MDA7027369.1 acetyltransferase [Bacillus changyiensis]